MSRDFSGWECKRAAACGGFVLPEVVDATSEQWHEIAAAQKAHLEWHEDLNTVRRAQAAEAHGVTA